MLTLRSYLKEGLGKILHFSNKKMSLQLINLRDEEELVILPSRVIYIGKNSAKILVKWTCQMYETIVQANLQLQHQDNLFLTLNYR